jgi:hypothetical protein
MLTAAQTNPHVVQVFRLYGSREADWRDLYFILEVIETDLGTTVAKQDGSPAVSGSDLRKPRIARVRSATSPAQSQ